MSLGFRKFISEMFMNGKFPKILPSENFPLYGIYLISDQLYTGFWKTYHLHINEISRISNFAPLWLYITCKTKFISAMILIIEGIISIYMQSNLPEIT